MAVYDGNINTGFTLREATQPVSIQINTLPATSSGVITAAFPAVPYDYYWYVEIISVSCNSTTSTQCYVYVDTPLQPQNVISTSNSGNLDQDDRNQAILVEPTKVMTIQWTGASLGSIGTARIQYKAMILIPGNGS